MDEPGALVRAAAGGDEVAWSRLVRRYTPLLWSIAGAYRLPAADAADCVQVTWLRLLDHAGRLENPEHVASWLATTVRRECLAALRRGGRVVPSGDPEALDRAAPPSDLPEAMLLRSERDRELWAAFALLSARCQQVLRVLVAEVDGRRPHYEQAAAALGMPVGSLGPTRARCLQHLRRHLEERGISAAAADSTEGRAPARGDQRW